MSDLLSAFSKYQVKQRVPPSASSRGRMQVDDMLQPEPDIASILDPYGLTKVKPADMPLALPVRLGPQLGKTVKVDDSRRVDVGRAFRMLNKLVSKNKVRQDVNRQKFHERPGLKKKRLKSERWRAQFKQSFRDTVRLVKKMRAQGW